LFKLAGKKVVVLPYGGDAYAYSRVRSTSLQVALNLSYPEYARREKEVYTNVLYWTKNADVILPGIMSPDGFGRWDVIVPSYMCLDMTQWLPTCRANLSNGYGDKVIIGHAPNHRGFKGTEFIIDAVLELQKEGFNVSLVLLEKLKNSDIKRSFSTSIDILVDQLICPGHGLTAIESMACGLPTIANLGDDDYTLPMRRWSYLDECPIVSATPETIKAVLKRLICDPALRSSLSEASRLYALKYHSYDSSRYLWSNIIDYLTGQCSRRLIDLYNPRISKLVMTNPVPNPLVNGRLP
jgi:hypothetical protein